MYKYKLTIKETDKSDLKNVMELWNDGEVMYYVGFPQGLNITLDKLEGWLSKLNSSKYTKHYSIYDENIGYCGETYYSIDLDHDLAALDIKLFPKAQGKGIAEYSLSYCINEVFKNNLASKVYVDPNPLNKKAWKLYEKLGFESKLRPDFLDHYETYLETTKDRWNR
ncbi:GNAT family protein [Clostridium sp. C8-1-8]|uniref:GNAT family N-acetyltransferase n=1 Tax=Clostridium sp. C8-1-8 TaxID=2698831 RepID=UPI00136BB469|nr:GNAT family protein [Clostridium sp. C8-1-8]